MGYGKELCQGGVCDRHHGAICDLQGGVLRMAIVTYIYIVQFPKLRFFYECLKLDMFWIRYGENHGESCNHVHVRCE